MQFHIVLNAVRLSELDQLGHIRYRKSSRLDSKIHDAMSVQAWYNMSLATVGGPGPAIDQETLPALRVDLSASP